MKIYVLSMKRKTWEVFPSAKSMACYFLGKRISEYVIFNGKDKIKPLSNDVFEIEKQFNHLEEKCTTLTCAIEDTVNWWLD